MKTTILLTKIIICVIALHLYSCENEIGQPIPEKYSELSQGTYDKYLGLLKEAYNTNDNFQKAIQLANLKGDKKATFHYLNLSVSEDLGKCDKIYEWYWLYDRHNFGVNLLKYDTTEFKKVISICEDLNPARPYQVYEKIKDEEDRQAEEKRHSQDSTNFNLELVAKLKQINDDDQEIRNKISEKNITPELEAKLFEEMHIVDSINLIKVDQIFEEYGYPSRELVGKDGNFTPALVIHHSNRLQTRYKYLPFLEQAVKDGLLYEGTLDMIKRRIDNMELDQEKGKDTPPNTTL